MHSQLCNCSNNQESVLEKARYVGALIHNITYNIVTAQFTAPTHVFKWNLLLSMHGCIHNLISGEVLKIAKNCFTIILLATFRPPVLWTSSGYKLLKWYKLTHWKIQLINILNERGRRLYITLVCSQSLLTASKSSNEMFLFETQIYTQNQSRRVPFLNDLINDQTKIFPNFYFSGIIFWTVACRIY